MRPVIFLPLFIAVIIVISNCSVQKGGIEVLENLKAT